MQRRPATACRQGAARRLACRGRTGLPYGCHGRHGPDHAPCMHRFGYQPRRAPCGHPRSRLCCLVPELKIGTPVAPLGAAFSNQLFDETKPRIGKFGGDGSSQLLAIIISKIIPCLSKMFVTTACAVEARSVLEFRFAYTVEENECAVILSKLTGKNVAGFGLGDCRKSKGNGLCEETHSVSLSLVDLCQTCAGLAPVFKPQLTFA